MNFILSIQCALFSMNRGEWKGKQEESATVSDVAASGKVSMIC